MLFVDCLICFTLLYLPLYYITALDHFNHQWLQIFINITFLSYLTSHNLAKQILSISGDHHSQDVGSLDDSNQAL